MKLRLGISTCPNDTFMFEALLHGRIDTMGYEFELITADIETLNQWAVEGLLDITKISFNAFATITDTYQLLRSGSAIGFKNGPLIVSNKRLYPEELPSCIVAIPGEKTTANLLLSYLYPRVKKKTVYLFSEIENAVLNNEVDAGVLIHETRFTYESRGLFLVDDLGQTWEKKTKLPLPLGGIAIRRNLATSDKKNIQSIVSQSVLYGMNNPEIPMYFVRQYAQELSEEIIKQHIELFVNKLSTWIAPCAEKAIRQILEIAAKEDNRKLTEPLFVS